MTTIQLQVVACLFDYLFVVVVVVVFFSVFGPRQMISMFLNLLFVNIDSVPVFHFYILNFQPCIMSWSLLQKSNDNCL